jgi:hypothetical protein
LSTHNDSTKGAPVDNPIPLHPLTYCAQTLLNCIDNSGASVVECVNVLKKKRPATIGESHPFPGGQERISNPFSKADCADTDCVVQVTG